MITYYEWEVKKRFNDGKDHKIIIKVVCILGFIPIYINIWRVF